MTEKENKFIRDLVLLLRENALAAKEEAKGKDAFAEGRHMAYYDVLSIIEQQADIFGLSKETIGLGDFNIEEELL